MEPNYPEVANCPEHGVSAKLKKNPWGKWQYSHCVDYQNKIWCNKDAKDISSGDADWVEQASPALRTYQAKVAPVQTREPIGEDKPDWDAIARGKVRHGVVTAMIQNDGLVPLTDDLIAELETYINYIMDGKR